MEMMLRNILCSTTLLAGVAVAQAMPHGPAPATRAESTTSESGSAEELIEKGHSLTANRDYEEAVEVFERALALDAGSLAARMGYVEALRRLGRNDEATRQLREALERFPDAQQPVVAMGYLNRELGRLDDSVAWFSRGAALEGGWYNFIRLAVSYTDLGDLERMEEAAAALADSPYGPALGRVLAKMFRSEFVAAREIAEAELARTDDELWRSLAADCAVLVGDDERALEHYAVLAAELIQDEPTVTRAHVTEALWLAHVLKRRGETTHAAELARAALALLTPAPGAHDRALAKVYRAAAHLLLGSTDAALGEFRAAVDQGFRSIMFARVVRFEDFDLFAPLLERPEFRSMLIEIKADNRRMLELLSRPTTRPPQRPA